LSELEGIGKNRIEAPSALILPECSGMPVSSWFLVMMNRIYDIIPIVLEFKTDHASR
jgi:hypothetical protein